MNHELEIYLPCILTEQCWCGVDADLTKNGGMLSVDECDTLCAGSTRGELCGGEFKMSAYEIKHEDDEATTTTYHSGYVGCYQDEPSARAMNEEGEYVPGDMTNEVSPSYIKQYTGVPIFMETRCQAQKCGVISK